LYLSTVSHHKSSKSESGWDTLLDKLKDEIVLALRCLHKDAVEAVLSKLRDPAAAESSADGGSASPALDESYKSFVACLDTCSHGWGDPPTDELNQVF
ncbi:hypothetical protein FRB99_003154, partial [Tulasnella sp. 403]